jgi:hypothetical protein
LRFMATSIWNETLYRVSRNYPFCAILLPFFPNLPSFFPDLLASRFPFSFHLPLFPFLDHHILLSRH